MKVLYFAWVRERVGMAEEEVVLPDRVNTVGALVAWMQTRSAGHAAAFEDHAVLRAAVNQEFAEWDAAVSDGDEVAFFPPVTGGCGAAP